VQVSLTGSGCELLDEVVIRTGIRSVDLHEWQFSLNAQREFIRGLNWVPADSFPGRLRSDNYTRLLKMARDSGANLLRVWGGGLREKRTFYDLCDELGMLVWQEFPFACLFLGSYPRDPAYLALVEAECSAIVRQLGRHPSLVVWCGGNEFSRSRNRPLLDTLAALVAHHDGTRPFIPVSPSFDRGGDAHNWHVWHGQAPIQHYQVETARFLSEFGLQALPHLDTLQATLPDPATGWETHHADEQKLKRYISLFDQQLRAGHNQSSIHNLQFTIHNSQLAQCAALQTAIEHVRRRKGEAGGVCVWQFNEPWPAISWAIVDYFGRPKLAYERLTHWYNPVLVSLKFPAGRRWQAGQTFSAEIGAINDSQQAFAGCELQVRLDGALIHSQRLDLPADSVQHVGQVSHCLTHPPGQITLNLYYEAEVLARNTYDLNWADEADYPLSARLCRRVADWVLR
jgi:beta-mannosidase